MNKISILLAFALGPAAFGQQQASQTVTKLVHLEYANADAVAHLIDDGPHEAIAVPNNGMHVVLLKGSPDAVKAAEELVKEMDVPLSRDSRRDIEVVVYVIGATSKAGSPTPVPQDLEPVVRQLRAAFPYPSYELLDSMALRSGGRPVITKGMIRNIQNSGNTSPTTYELRFEAASTPSGGRSFIRFEQFQFSTSQVFGTSAYPVTINTDLDVQPGQKVVVGKTDIDGGESALFVVLTAKLLD